MTTEILPYSPPGQAEIEYYWNLAKTVCPTEFVPSNLRNRPEATIAVFMAGREMGIGPMQSLRDIYPVNGRPTQMATLMVTRVRALGHRFKTVKSTDQEAIVQVHRRGDPEPEPAIRWTLADAKRAGLLGKEVWQKYPTAMLWARAASAACRRDASEALGGVIYTPEEIENGDGATTSATWGAPELAEQEVSKAPEVGTPRPASGPTAGSGAGTPPGAGPAATSEGLAARGVGQIADPSDPSSLTPTPPPPTAEGEGGPRPERPPTSPGRRSGRQSRSEVPAGASGGTTMRGGEATSDRDHKRTSTGRGDAPDAVTSVKQAGSAGPGNDGEGDADPSLTDADEQRIFEAANADEGQDPARWG